MSTVWKCDEKDGRSERHTEKRGEGRMSCDQAIDYMIKLTDRSVRVLDREPSKT